MKITSKPLKRIKIKFILFMVSFVTALFSVIAVTLTWHLQQVSSIMVSIAGMPVLERAAVLINGDKYERLTHAPDTNDPFYIETQEKLRELKENSRCLYLYAMAPYKEGIHRYIFDAEDPNSEDFSPLGSEESLVGFEPAYLKTYETKTPQFSRMIDHPRWGRLISAYMPILNSKGDVVGVIGVDFQGKDIYNETMTSIAWQVVFAVLFIAVGLVFYFFLLKDLTKQSERLWTMSQRAEAASRTKSDFLARMSHEIRTPMNAVTGMAELALRENLSETVREHVATIKQAGANLLAIINDILDFSKIESGKLEIVPVDYLFSSLVNDITGIIRTRVVDSQVRFVVNIDSNIPNALHGDEMRIRQVLLNILSNAAKFTERGHISISATGETVDDNTINLIIEVSDTGKGIKPEDIEKLFKDFVQIDPANNRGIEGTGLGLSIVHSLVKAMGGDILVTSEYGKGTTFTVTVPQKVRDHKKLATVNNSEEKRILVYERREVYANSILYTINNLGVECTLVSTDSQFRDSISSTYSFVFISSTLYENVKEILRKRQPDAKTVLLAGFGESTAEPNISVLTMPAHSVLVANIINGVTDRFSYSERSEFVVRFTAPSANVLIVDDIRTNLNVAEGLLLPYEMRVNLCTNGWEALEAITVQKYDLVLMDHMMPNMDGIETVKRIRALGLDDPYYKNVPIIALTANAVSGTREMFLENGFDDFLSKPINTIELNTILERWIPENKRKKIPYGFESNVFKANSISNVDLNLNIDGVDVKKGVSMCGRNVEHYKRVLALFQQDGIEKCKEITKCLETNNLLLYVIHVHAVKSAAANIGANALSEMAKTLEIAGDQGDLAFVQKHTAPLLSALEMLTDNIKIALNSIRQNERNDSVDMNLLKAELAKLAEAVDSVDPLAIITAVKSIQPFADAADVDGDIERILQKTLIGEYDEAVSMIKKFMA
jgi:signal transduction histidine kinase/CheY-like chemotaxis protein